MWGENLKWVADAILEVGDHVRFMCNTCKTATIQELEAIHQIVRFDSYSNYDPNDIWQQELVPEEEECQYRLFICQGCGTACLHEAVVNVVAENQIGMSSFHPERYEPNKPRKDLIPKRYNSLPPKLYEAYKEAITTYNSDLLISCAVVLRALLEGICIERGITDKDAWGLESKLDMMRERGILPVNIVDGLHMFKFMGDDAAHRLETPDKQGLKAGIEVMEDLLNVLYEINYRLTLNSEKLAKNRPNELEKIKQCKDKKVKNQT